ncbi:MAG: hypothetical protein Q4F41_07440 [Eubacteriales bacterium]|nr:hypothetical protein [Eubacteriales bacterium]
MKAKRLLALLSAAAVASGTFTGYGYAEETSADVSEHVDITIGGINLSSSDSVDGWPSEVVQKLEEKFNVTLKIKHYDNESLNLDLAGGTTCDIVQINDDHIEGVIKGKHAVNLEDYQDTLAANIFREDMSFRNSILKEFKSNGEGVQYFVTPRVTFGDTEANYGTTLNYGYIVRWDLYKAIGCPEINNDEDYIEALKAMKEIYPETEDGLPVYALSAYNDSQLHAYFFKGCLAEGYVNLEGGLYVQNAETNELLPDIYDVDNPEVLTPFWSGVQFFNQLYREGLLDPDCLITKGEDLMDKYTKGQYLGGVNGHFSGYNQAQRTADSETLKEFVILPSKLGWANEKNLAGWFGKYYFVSSHSENVERAVMVLDYLQSEEFSRDIDSGIEGRWTIGEDGTPALTEDTISMKNNTERQDEWNSSGIREGNMAGMCGEDYYNVASDGGLINLWYEEEVLTSSMTAAQKDMCETLNLSVPSDLLKNHVEAGTSIDLGNCMNVIQLALETTPKNIVRIDSNCEELAMNALPSLIQAETDEEFAAAKAALLEELKNAGAEESVEWWTNAWAEAKQAIEALQ